ncbi:MAG: hypothetical protein ILP12_02820 [Lachnospiraceae bacterium]|nr:hypothetical protein [Lachnospiraceae bacterium]
MKKSADSVIGLIALAFAVVGLILFLITNGTAGYGVPGSGLAIVCGIAAILLIACIVFVFGKNGNQHPTVFACRLLAIVALMAELGILLADRAGLAANIFTWDNGNKLGWSVFYMSVACAVCILLAVITLIVASFRKGEE